MTNTVAIGLNWVVSLALVRHSECRGSETIIGQVMVDRVSERSKLALSKVNFAVAFGILFAQSPAPVPQPKGVLLAVTSPHSAGVAVITALVNCAFLGDNVRLNIVADTGRHQHLNGLDRHFHNMTIWQRLGSLDRIGVSVEDVDRTTPLDTISVTG